MTSPPDQNQRTHILTQKISDNLNIGTFDASRSALRTNSRFGNSSREKSTLPTKEVVHSDFQEYKPLPVLKSKILDKNKAEPQLRFFYEDVRDKPKLRSKYTIYPFLSTIAKPVEVKPNHDPDESVDLFGDIEGYKSPDKMQLDLEERFARRPQPIEFTFSQHC